MKLAELTELLKPSSKHGDGHLVLNNPNVTWTLSFVRGQLLYATDEIHAVRRWSRILKQHCPNWNWQVDAAQVKGNPFWQIQLLDQGINRQKLSLIRAKFIIRTIAQECLFELSQFTTLNSDWKPLAISISRSCRSVALSRSEMQMTLGKVERMEEQWQDARLEKLSPTLSPTLRQGADTRFLPIAHQYLSGKFTLWDIAGQLDKSLTEIVESLNPSVEKGIIEFRGIPDLSMTVSPLPVSQPSAPPAPTVRKPVAARPIQPPLTPTSKPTTSTDNQPLIACIDDSPVLAHSLKKILVPAGYRVLSIQEPMRGFSQLIEHKPSLILLDLLLPNADGYSICKFLRDTPVFEKTPIIILTGQNTPIDRARARLVRATEFLAKPPRREQLLQMIHKHLYVYN